MQHKTYRFINIITYIIVNLLFTSISVAQVRPYIEPFSYNNTYNTNVEIIENSKKIIFNKNNTIQQYRIDTNENIFHYFKSLNVFASPNFLKIDFLPDLVLASLFLLNLFFKELTPDPALHSKYLGEVFFTSLQFIAA